MNKKTLMLIAALALGGAATANATVPNATTAKPAKVQTQKKAAAVHHMAPAKKPAKHS